MNAQKLALAAEGVPAVPFRIPGSTGEFRIQLLNQDSAAGVVTSIIHIPAGGRIPAHRHSAGSEMHYVLEGDLIEAGEALGPGAFLTHAAGQLHGPHESRQGAKVLTVQSWQSQHGDYDFEPAEQAGADPGGEMHQVDQRAQEQARRKEGEPGARGYS
ncbi:cupin domain-containing protein [Falsiroseomonas sp.]|uniref:cupin domain-containing protein n=1 Tax=Falsiroseomonas sp. TaxID=2870721 RepID=UPI003562DC75